MGGQAGKFSFSCQNVGWDKHALAGKVAVGQARYYSPSFISAILGKKQTSRH
jgi:hypothetical protein